MASSGSLAAGTTSYSSTLTAATADLVEFLDRYAYLAVTNLSADALLYVRTDGQAASDADGETDSYAVPPGDTRLFANAMGIWYPSSRVIPQGELEFGGGNTASGPSSPGAVTAMESLAGQRANPGTRISIISSSAAQYTVAAAG